MKYKLIPETMKAQLANIPVGKRTEFIRACIALVERHIAKAEIDLIKMMAEC